MRLNLELTLLYTLVILYCLDKGYSIGVKIVSSFTSKKQINKGVMQESSIQGDTIIQGDNINNYYQESAKFVPEDKVKEQN